MFKRCQYEFGRRQSEKESSNEQRLRPTKTVYDDIMLYILYILYIFLKIYIGLC